MPDRDVLTRSIPRGWLKPYRLILGEATPLEVAVAMGKALAAAMRLGGGIPGMGAFADIVRNVLCGRLDPADGLRELRHVACASGGHRHTMVAAEQAIARLIVEVGNGASVADSVDEVIAERVLKGLVEYALLGRVRDELVGRRFASYGEALAWEEEQLWTELEPIVHSIATQLARDPTGKRVRAPRTGHRVRRSTADMLHEPIEGLGSMHYASR